MMKSCLIFLTNTSARLMDKKKLKASDGSSPHPNQKSPFLRILHQYLKKLYFKKMAVSVLSDLLELLMLLTEK